MLITDLNYLEPISDKNFAVSGGYATASAHTIADYGLGYAQADAVAFGQSTLTMTKTSTDVLIGYFYAITSASAKAHAQSITASSHNLADASSTSLYISTF